MNALSSVSTAVDCPAWCIRWDHNADEVDATHPPMHYGPEFGIFSAQSDGEPEVTIHEAITFKGALSAAGLRKVAADALQAAAWLETH